jgi:hypothetical protein
MPIVSGRQNVTIHAFVVVGINGCNKPSHPASTTSPPTTHDFHRNPEAGWSCTGEDDVAM